MNNPTPGDSPSSPPTEISETLRQISELRSKAEEHLAAIEQLRRSSDEHATYSHQAKVNSETNAKEASSFRGTVESTLSTIKADKANLDQLIAALTQQKAYFDGVIKEMDSAKKGAEASLKEINESQKKATLASDEIAKRSDTVVTLAEESIKLKEASEKAKGAIENILKSSNEISQKTADHLSKSEGFLSSTTKYNSSIELLLDECKAKKQDLESIIKHISESDEQTRLYEDDLEGLLKKLSEVTTKAENLLPGFTTASLAHSFGAQRERFAGPQRRWLLTFQICLGLLLLVAAPSFFSAVFGELSEWEGILRGMVMRLPIVIPIVWLAIYSGRNYMLSVRIEEDYAYKEALSRAFEGYKREMSAIDTNHSEKPTPLNRLCLNILNALAERPGRVYEGRQTDYSISDEAKAVLSETNDLGARKVSGGSV